MFLSLTLSFSRSQTHTQTRAWPFPWSQLTFTQRRLWFFFRFLLPLSKIAFSIPIFSPLALIHPTLFCPPSSSLFNHLRSYFDFTCLLSSSPSPTASHYLPNPPPLPPLVWFIYSSINLSSVLFFTATHLQANIYSLQNFPKCWKFTFPSFAPFPPFSTLSFSYPPPKVALAPFPPSLPLSLSLYSLSVQGLF